MLGVPPATYYGLAPTGTSETLSVEALVGADADETSCGSTTTTGITFNGQPRQAFSLNVLAYGSGAATGCGTPGASVRLVFRQGEAVVGQYNVPWDNTRLVVLGIQQIYLPRLGTAATPMPDLEVLGVTLAAAPADSGKVYELQVTIRNAGDAAIATPFWVDLYLDPDQAPQPGEGWPAVAAFGASWRVYDLAAGATLTLSSLSPNDPTDPGKSYTVLPTFLDGASYTVYVQADAYSPDGSPNGAVTEQHEDNNIGGPYTITVGPTLDGDPQ
jgi:hypothetical protein